VAKNVRTARVTLRDISKVVGVTPQAVSQALREAEGGGATTKVSEKLRKKVQKVADKMGYRKDTIAQALRYSGLKSGLMGVLAFRAVDQSFPDRLFHSLRQFKTHGVNPLVQLAEPSSEESCSQACHALIDSRVDGVLLLGPPREQAFKTSHLQLFSDAGVRMTAFHGGNIPGISTFQQDTKHAFRALASHLIEMGNRSLTLLSNTIDRQTSVICCHMVEGLEEAVALAEKQGIGITMRYAQPDSAFQNAARPIPDIHDLYTAGYSGMRDLIRRGEVPDAVLCQSDNFALGAMRACKESGIRIPEDMAITGFGAHGEGSAGYLPLTTFTNDFETVCRESIDELIAIVRGENRPADCHLLKTGRLVIRESSLRKCS